MHSQSNRNRDAEAPRDGGGGGAFGQQSRPDNFVLGGCIGRRPTRPDRRALYGSLGVHGALVAFIVGGTLLQAQALPEFETFTVKIYSPPPQVEGPPPPEPKPEVIPTIVAERTVETPPAPTPRPAPPKPVEQTPVDKPEEKPPEPEPVTGENADPESTGGENIDLDQIGDREFPFPDYLENIIRQINRHFRGWSGDGKPSAQIAFYINRDGSIGGLTLVEKSPDFKFNLQTMSAVELAGRNKAFGDLPEGWVADRLWVRFRFIPPGR